MIVTVATADLIDDAIFDAIAVELLAKLGPEAGKYTEGDIVVEVDPDAAMILD